MYSALQVVNRAFRFEISIAFIQEGLERVYQARFRWMRDEVLIRPELARAEI